MNAYQLGPTLSNHGRRVLSVFDSTTFTIAIAAICSVIGIVLLALIVWAFLTKCGRKSSAPVAPASAAQEKTGDVEKGVQAAPKDKAGLAPPEAQSVAASKTASSARVPPWVSDPGRLPPGIMLTPVPPPTYDKQLKKMEEATQPCERLVLISSRVHTPQQVAAAVLPNVGYLVYDWKNFTLQELLLNTKKVIGVHKVTSIAVVAPGSKPGGVGLLEGASTTADKLRAKSELSQFWRVLAGCVSLSGTADGRRVDLLGCRVVEAPREGAELLRELTSQTSVTFAAAENAVAGFPLCTGTEDPDTKHPRFSPHNVAAMDLYFNRHALLGTVAPAADGLDALAVAGGTAAAVAAAPALPGQASPESPAVGPVQEQGLKSAPPPGPALAAASAAVPERPTSSAPLPDGKDVFSRLTRGLAKAVITPEEAFKKYDKDGSGQLSPEELAKLMNEYVPDASEKEIQYFQVMVDIDATPTDQDSYKVALAEFVKGLPEGVEVHRLVRERADETEVISRLKEYFMSNNKEIKQTFEDFDEDNNNTLDTKELGKLVLCIPDLTLRERKVIMTYLYEYDPNQDREISFEELLAILEAFDKTPPAAVPAGAQSAAGLAAGAAAGAVSAVAQSAAGEVQGAAALVEGRAAGAEAAAEQAAVQAERAAQQAGQAAVGQGQAAAGQVQAAAGQVQGEVKDAADEAMQGTKDALGAAAGSPPPPSLAPALAPLGPPRSQLAPLAPLGGKLGPLAPLGGPPRPGALEPLSGR